MIPGARGPKARARQRGAALILLAALVVLGISWMIVSALGNAARTQVADQGHNAGVLREARAALVGWVAMSALSATEDNPGRLPCPQAWGDIGTANEGRAASFCAAPAAGLLPYKTLGLPKLLDSAGQQLWYVVSPGWHLPNSTTDLLINSNTAGQLTLDGQANAAVALLIAPGRPLSIVPNASQTAAGCAARLQSHTFGGTLNVLNFLDCHNATTADYAYVTTVVDNATNPVFNDQVLAVTTADLLPGIEASIAKRIERDIVPALKAVYATADWGLSTTNPVFPYAAPFAHAGPGAGTSDYRGVAATYEGLLPFNQTQGCTESAADPRCTTSFLVFAKASPDALIGGSGSIRTQSSCSWQSDVYVCTGEYNQPSVQVRFTLNVTNVAMGLRALDATRITCTAVDDVGNGIPQQNVSCSVAASAIQPDGSVTLTIDTALTPDIVGSGWGTYANYSIRVQRAAIGDHALLSTTAATTGWFARNEWYRLVYYAASAGHVASATAPRACSDAASSCVQVSNFTPPNKRAILILAGRSLGNAMRPNATLGDFLEGANAITASSPRFEQRTVTAAFNDRILVLDANP
jgi:hypothetical protein